MKSLMILSCVLLYIGSIQGISIPPERPFGPHPPLWEEPSSVDSSEEATTTEEPDVVMTSEEPSSTDDSDEENDHKVVNATLVQICVEMLVNGEIALPESTTTAKTTSSASSTANSTEKQTTMSDHEAVTTNSTRLDDEVETTTDNVVQKESTTVSTAATTEATGPAMLFGCNFEHGWCGIEQDTVMDQFNWTLADYPTPSSLTGPERAYSGTHYIFIEASRPALANNESAILLPPLSAEHGEKTCLQFKYHMYGYHIRELKAYVESSSQGSMKPRWELGSISGDQGNLWHHAQMSFYRSSGDRVGFLGIRGLQYSGDIALDDILITSGFCDEQNVKPSGNNEVN